MMPDAGAGRERRTVPVALSPANSDARSKVIEKIASGSGGGAGIGAGGGAGTGTATGGAGVGLGATATGSVDVTVRSLHPTVVRTSAARTILACVSARTCGVPDLATQRRSGVGAMLLECGVKA
jgi:hypothetical protein